MIVKNTTEDNIYINKSVQVDINTVNENDGIILPSQTLDLAKSLTNNEIVNDQALKAAVYSGDIVFVIEEVELSKSESIEIYESGPSEWSKIFNPVIAKDKLYESLGSGYLYVRNFLIG